MPDFFRSGPRAIVSARFRKVCDAHSVAAEFLPIKVLQPNGESAIGEPYGFLHLLERVDCIDYQRSVFQAWSERPDSEFRRLSKLVFHEDLVRNKPLIKPKRYSQLFVSQELRDALLRADCVVRFIPSDEVVL